jgi:hypothetical protein
MNEKEKEKWNGGMPERIAFENKKGYIFITNA